MDAVDAVRIRTALLLGLLVPVLLTSCGNRTGSDASDPVVVMTTDKDGDGSGMAAIVTGKVSVASDGCVHLDDRLVVWPKGTTWSPRGTAVVLPDGVEIAVGSTAVGGGGYVKRGELALFVSDRQMLSRCAASDEVAVFNPGSSVSPSPAS